MSKLMFSMNKRIVGSSAADIITLNFFYKKVMTPRKVNFLTVFENFLNFLKNYSPRSEILASIEKT